MDGKLKPDLETTSSTSRKPLGLELKSQREAKQQKTYKLKNEDTDGRIKPQLEE